MIKLYDSAFSPFARKVRMVLDHKGLSYEAVDGLLKSSHGALKAVNGRVEVPVLVDGDIVVVNSPDIVAYLDERYPANPIYPHSPAARVHARAWERTSDTLVDPIFVDISYWKWAERPDPMPPGLLEAARADLALVYDALDRELAQREFVSGPLSVADIALFPHLASAQSDGSRVFGARAPEPDPLVQSDARTAGLCCRSAAGARLCVGLKDRDVERHKIFWRGDRVEWMLARGFHAWFFDEIRHDRVAWPGPALPAPMPLDAGADLPSAKRA